MVLMLLDVRHLVAVLVVRAGTTANEDLLLVAVGVVEALRVGVAAVLLPVLHVDARAANHVRQLKRLIDTLVGLGILSAIAAELVCRGLRAHLTHVQVLLLLLARLMRSDHLAVALRRRILGVLHHLLLNRALATLHRGRSRCVVALLLLLWTLLLGCHRFLLRRLVLEATADAGQVKRLQSDLLRLVAHLGALLLLR